MLEMNIEISDSDDCCTLRLSLKASCDGCSRHRSNLGKKKKKRTVRNVCTKPWGEEFKNHRFRIQREKYSHAWMEIDKNLSSKQVQLKTSTNNLEILDGNETNQDDHSHVLRLRKRKEHLAPHVSLSVHTFDNIYIFNLCSYIIHLCFCFSLILKHKK